MPRRAPDNQQRPRTCSLALLLIIAFAPAARAQQEPPSAEAASTSPPSVDEPSTPPEVRLELRCERVTCLCAAPPVLRGSALLFRPRSDCRTTQCRCVEAPPPEAPPSEAPPEPATTSDALQPPRPAAELGPAYDPAPLFGFTLARREVGLRLDVGFPFVDLALSLGAHDIVEVGLGYQGLYGQTNAPYASLRVQLYRTPSRSAAVSLQLMGGYTFVSDGEGHDKPTLLVGGDAGFGDLSLQLSAGRYRHSFVAALGLRLAWVRRQIDISSYRDSWLVFRIFEDGEPGLSPLPYLEFGYIGRVGRSASIFLTSGLTGSPIGDRFSAMARARAGVLFDLHRRSGR